MDEARQNPEQILKQIEKEEQSLNRGHLKIFFGYAAGVGKTYAMLKAAHSAKKHGIDVVAGYIEPHARPQTSACLLYTSGGVCAGVVGAKCKRFGRCVFTRCP